MMMENPRVLKTMNGVQVSADEDTELSIFDAKRYFNESNSDPRVCKRVSPLDIPNLVRVSSDHDAGRDNSALPLPGRFSSSSSAADGYGYGRTYRVRSFHATPTPSSEASWNSQTGLLSNPTGAIAVSMTTTTTNDNRKRPGKKRWLWQSCCPCSGKNSVQVEPKAQSSLNPKLNVDDQKRQDIPVIQLPSSNPHSISEENHEFHSSLGQRVIATTTTRVPLMISNGSGTAAGFTFPILNQQPKPSHVEMAVNRNNSSVLVIDHKDRPRESLDVFLPPDESNSVPKKLASRITVADDDVASDTSSDLFEIESLSTTTKGQSQSTASYPTYNRRDSLDEALHFNTIRSISGASGFSLGCPYPQMVTECYEPSEASIEWSVATAEGFERGSVGVSEAEENYMHGIGNGNYSIGGKKKSGEGGLLSCRSQKAVSVGPNPVKYVPPGGQAATTLKHVGSVNNPRLSRLSLPFSS
ncbi:hypothetical protein V6N12_018053 [Hibiscus sabdariffa]|uniref:Uncharacterized protein n=1 Tax=Hibiscus sabdariffa TaxID=183260 RepID=A0ABR2APW2_9ROSI